MNKKTIIFDFDGTIADTLDATVRIYNRIAPEFRCKTINQKDQKIFRAKRLQEFFRDYGVTNIKLPFLLICIKKELRSQILDIKPINGIAQALKEIKVAGFNLGIMTSNSKDNVEMFLITNDLSEIFDFIYSGNNIFGKDKVIDRLLRENRIEKETVVYVGDETRDIDATKKVKIPIIAVSWGFNTKNALKTLKPAKIVDHPKDLFDCLQKI
jgi:phosphoglycolate phosphatase